MRLRYETHRNEKPQTTHPFRSALKITALSAALLLPMGTVNPVFAKKAGIPTNYHEYAQSLKPQLDGLWNAKVRFAAAEFKKQHPHSKLVEQDYGVIKTINASLPEQRRPDALEWLGYQNLYLTVNEIDFSHTPQSYAIQAAIDRTKQNYLSDILAAAESERQKPAQAAVNTPALQPQHYSKKKSISHSRATAAGKTHYAKEAQSKESVGDIIARGIMIIYGLGFVASVVALLVRALSGGPGYSSHRGSTSEERNAQINMVRTQKWYKQMDIERENRGD